MYQMLSTPFQITTLVSHVSPVAAVVNVTKL